MGALAVNAMVTGVEWTLALGISGSLIVWGWRLLIDLVGEATRG